MKPLIRPETSSDQPAIREVNRLAFGGEVEARIVDDLRDGQFMRISLVAECDGSVVGHICFSDLTIVTSTGTVPALALAPMSVLPGYQRRGIGSELVRRGLEVCKELGHRIVVVLGHPEFYPRFGFSSELAKTLESPYAGGAAWMAMELAAGALRGVAGSVEYTPPFADC